MDLKTFVKNQKRLLIIAVVFILVAVIGISFALFMQTNANSTNQIIVSGDLKLNVTNCTIETEELLPIPDEEGMAQAGCNITIENTGSLDAIYKLKIKDKTGTVDPLGHEYLKISTDESAPDLISNKTLLADGSKELLENTILVGATKIHNVKIWIKEDAPDTISGKDVKLVVEVEAEVFEDESLRAAILNSNGGASAIKAKNVNLAATPTAETSGMYAVEDDYGTSYYFRGVRDSLNNNLIFAGFQWKIVRVNGDGSIRLIYNGECPSNSCTMNTTGTETQINSTNYKFNDNSTDNKYVGYMYGGANGVASTTLEEAITNETDSNAKAQIDIWYQANLASYASHISDNIFCNDRSITSGDGYGAGITYYGAYARLYTNANNPTPTLKCPQKNDAFTVNDTEKGNGALTYPIGLITADEVQFGGNGSTYYDANQYLYTNQNYWTMSPYSMGSPVTLEWRVLSNGNLYDSYTVDTTTGLRPIINLVSNTQITSGNGSAEKPYVIE